TPALPTASLHQRRFFSRTWKEEDLPACCRRQREFPPERKILSKSPEPTEMGNNPYCLSEPDEGSHLMQAEEKQARAKFSLPPEEVKVDEERVNVQPTGQGRAWVFGLIGYCVPQQSDSGAVKNLRGVTYKHTFTNIFSVF
ncbi:hypothetical protein CRENBAI_010263, partial [Crenichthys baileyi]